MTTHNLKTWPEFYNAIAGGEKTFDLRKDDRGFHVGDVLCMQEWSPRTKEYTGRELAVTVTYIVSGFGLQPGWVAMGFGRP